MAHTFDTSAITRSSSTSISLSYTCGANATVLVVGLAINGRVRAGGALTYNGVTMLQAGITQSGPSSNATAELWYLINPLTGSAANIVIPNAGGEVTIEVIASSYKAAPGFSSTLDTATGSGASGSDPTDSITTAGDGNVIVDVLCTAGGAATASKTNISSGTLTTEWYGSQYSLQATAGLIDMSWTASAGKYGHCVASFAETSVNNKNLLMMMGIGS